MADHSELFSLVQSEASSLVAMSQAIWSRPEIGFQEYFASKTLTDWLAERGFSVQLGLCGLDTAFAASAGDGQGPHVVFVAEYDALPGLGHACGHNLYCCAAAGAAWALLKATGGRGLKVSVYGAPAEEGTVPDYGGKTYLVEGGLFEGVHMAMICHGEDQTVIERTLAAVTSTTAVFHGRKAHAGGSPEEGINALSACLLAYNNVNALRQQFLPGMIIAPIITEGGESAATIPDRCVMEFSIRGQRKEHRDFLSTKVDHCLEAAALVTDCSVDIKKKSRPSDDLLPNHQLGLAFRGALLELGYDPSEIQQKDQRSFGWDMGNVSKVCPTLAPYMKMGPKGLVGHTDQFREYANSPEAHRSLIDAAKAMAATAWDYLSSEELRRAVAEEFEKNR